MKLTVAAVPVIVGRFEITIRKPGIVRSVGFERKSRLVMSQGAPDFEEVPVLFIEASPEAPAQKRTFTVIRHGDVVDPAEDELATWCGTGISAGMGVVHVFEMTTVVES